MKKCPVCKAEIPEDARFCIHCMTSFQEKETIQPPRKKRRWWLIVLVALLVSLLIGMSLLGIDRNPTAGTTGSAGGSESTNTGHPPASEQAAGQTGETNEATGSVNTVVVPENALPVQSTPGTIPTTQASTPAGITAPTETTLSEETTTPTRPTQTTQPSQSTQPTEPTTPPETTQPDASSQTVTVGGLTYRLVCLDDVFADSVLQHHFPNMVAVTGVASVASDGVYTIPNVITWSDGTEKTVVGIADYAFAGTNARVVRFVDDNRWGLGRYALSGCPLEVFYSNTGIYIHDTAFSGCPQGFILCTEATNGNQYGEFFQFSAGRYGAVWKQYGEYFG